MAKRSDARSKGGGLQVAAEKKYRLTLNSFEPWMLKLIGVESEAELFEQYLLKRPVNGQLAQPIVPPADLESWTFFGGIQQLFEKAYELNSEYRYGANGEELSIPESIAPKLRTMLRDAACHNAVLASLTKTPDSVLKQVFKKRTPSSVKYSSMQQKLKRRRRGGVAKNGAKGSRCGNDMSSSKRGADTVS